MIALTAAEVALVTGGALHAIDPATVVAGPVVTDSREVIPGALFVAVADPRRCLAVSAWTGWAAIDEATGGRPMDPVRGSFSDRLATRTIDHYEFVPNTEHVAAVVPE